MKLILIYFIEPNLSEVVSSPHLINIEIINEVLSFFFNARSSQPSVYFTLTAYLNVDEPHFKCSGITSGQWLLPLGLHIRMKVPS